MKKTFATLMLLITLGLAPGEVFAARLYMAGYEWRVPSYEENNGGTTATSTVRANGGTISRVVSSIAATSQKSGLTHIVQGGAIPEGYMRVYVNVDILQASANTYIGIGDSNGGTGYIGFVKLYDNAGSLALDVFNDKGGTQITDTATVSYDTWHMIEIYRKANNVAGSDILTVRVDGVQVATASNLTYTDAPNAQPYAGVYNDGGTLDSTSVVYFDDVAVNDITGTAQNSWPGAGKIALALPNAAGFVACNLGSFSSINEVPPSNNSTGASDRCEIQTNGGITPMFNVTNSTTLGIDSFDIITVVAPLARMIKATSLAANYFMVISANGSATTSGTSTDLPFASGVLTNSTGAASFTNNLFSYTNPSTGVAWTPTGTNSIDSMQIGIGSTDANPDVYIITLAAMVEYRDVILPLGPLYYSVGKLILTNGKMAII